MNGYIVNHTFDEIEVGDSASVEHMLTYKDIQLFAVMSGDVNPAHVDKEYAESDLFHKIVAHGMWTGSMISTVLGTELPGPGTIYLEQTFKFLKPVTIGDTITARVTVSSKDPVKKTVVLDCVCINQQGKEIIRGEATVLAPLEKVRRKRIALPQVEFKNEKCPNHHRIICMAEGLEPILTAVVHPVDRLSLEGALIAAESKLIKLVLVGPEDKIRVVAKKENLDISGISIYSTPHSHASFDSALSNARGPSRIPPVICPLSAILQRAVASSVDGIFSLTVSTADKIATLGIPKPTA